MKNHWKLASLEMDTLAFCAVFDFCKQIKNKKMVKSYFSLAWQEILLLIGICDILVTGLVRGSRDKRVIHGTPLLERDSPYSAVQYYVWLAKLSSSDRHQGGGALITPRIVQTACHVLSKHQYVRVKGKPFSRAVVQDHWANRIFAYIGYNSIDHPGNKGIGSSRFHIHPKCGRLIQGEWEVEYWVIHDFGWVYLSESVDDLIERHALPNKYIRYAPQYTVKDLGRHYNYVTTSRSVCLTMGYGSTKWDEDKCCTDDLASASKFLRHGWNLVYDYMTCYYLSRAWYNKHDWYYEPVEYKDVATWICGSGIPQDGGRTKYQGHGDSGSPVTCNNAYISVVSGGQNEKLYDGIFSPAVPYLQIQAAIAFVPFENSFDFRTTFEAFMKCGCYESHGDRGWNVTFRPWRGTLRESGNQPHSLAHHISNSHMWYGSSILYFLLTKK